MSKRYRNILIGIGLLFSCGLVAQLAPAREVKSDTAVIRLVPTYTNTPAIIEPATPAARLLLGTATALPTQPPPTPSDTPTEVVLLMVTVAEPPPATVAPAATLTPLQLWAPVLATGSSCDCSGDRYKCDDFAQHAEAQGCFEYCLAQGAGDVHRLDKDGDGMVCEDR